MSFLGALKSGKNGEELLIQLFRDASIECQSNPKNKDVEWDVSGTLFGLDFHVEAKFDLMEAKTKNIAVEYHNPKLKKPSGIFATKSDLWAIILSSPLTIWIARTSDLKKYVEKEPCLKDIEVGGDKNASLKLFNRDSIFADIFHRIDELPPWELSDLLIRLLGTKHERLRDKVVAGVIQDRVEW